MKFYKSIEFSSVHHLTDDTNLILTDKSMKKINKHINRDLKLVVQWIRANKLSLNTSKTELVIFKPKNEIITKHFNFRISGQKIKPSSQVKYLGIILHDDLHWNSHLTKLRKQLSRSIGLLSKVRYYVPKHLLRTIYHSIFNSHLIYACEIWGQNQTNYYFKKLLRFQEKALRITDFKPRTSLFDCIFLKNKILKISDFVKYKYAHLVRKSLRKENVVIFNNMFTPLNLNHDRNTRTAIKHLLDIPQKQTCHYGTYSMVFTASKIWNHILRKSNKDLLYCDLSAFKKTIFERFFSKYENDN